MRACVCLLNANYNWHIVLIMVPVCMRAGEDERPARSCVEDARCTFKAVLRVSSGGEGEAAGGQTDGNYLGVSGAGESNGGGGKWNGLF